MSNKQNSVNHIIPLIDFDALDLSSDYFGIIGLPSKTNVITNTIDVFYTVVKTNGKHSLGQGIVLMSGSEPIAARHTNQGLLSIFRDSAVVATFDSNVEYDELLKRMETMRLANSARQSSLIIN